MASQRTSGSVRFGSTDPAYLLEQVSDAAVVVDSAGTIVLFNGAAEELFGYAADEVVGGPLGRLVPAGVSDHHQSLVDRFLSGDSGRRLMASDREVVQGVRKDGSMFPAAITVGPLDLGADARLAMATVRDETTLVAMNRRLAELSSQLESRNEELQQFLLSASHDLREPVRKVRTFAAELAEALPADLDEWAQLCVDRTIDAGDRMWVLLDELIGYSRLTTTEPGSEPCDLGEIVREAIDDLSLRITEAGAVIEVVDLPHVVGDRILLRQLFFNILGNAIKFARPGVPPVVMVAAGEGGEAMVAIDVDDNGIGIEAGYEERAFEPFRRVHKVVDVEGSGMGLAICRKVARIHGGDVRALPNPSGTGTRMRVLLAKRS